MADFLVSNSMLMLEKAMNFQWTKQSTILNNVVNADTPGYKTKYVTFEEALRSSLRSARMGSQPLSSMRSAISSASPAVHTADDEQLTEAVRNAYQLNYTFRAISSDMNRLMMAIRGQ